jgi:hypothetical protein
MKIQNKKLIITALLIVPFLSNLIWYVSVVLPNYSMPKSLCSRHFYLFQNQFIGGLAILSSIVFLPIVLFLTLNNRFYSPNIVSKQLKNGKKRYDKNTRG